MHSLAYSFTHSLAYLLAECNLLAQLSLPHSCCLSMDYNTKLSLYDLIRLEFGAILFFHSLQAIMVSKNFSKFLHILFLKTSWVPYSVHLLHLYKGFPHSPSIPFTISPFQPSLLQIFLVHSHIHISNTTIDILTLCRSSSPKQAQ